jgi:hypothetical protein
MRRTGASASFEIPGGTVGAAREHLTNLTTGPTSDLHESDIDMFLPQPHAAALEQFTSSVADDGRFLGLAAGGSILTGDFDAYSDLDLIVVVADKHHASVMQQRAAIAATWGTLLAAFPGDHVGEPRLLICLYADPLLHVDLKFLSLDELAHRVEDPLVLWESAEVISQCLRETGPAPQAVDAQWVEDRFWIWIHYAATKLGRGELFEVLDMLAYVRGQVLVPLASQVRGSTPRGVRRVEQQAPDLVPALALTVASHDPRGCASAIGQCVRMYRDLRGELSVRPHLNLEAEMAAVQYLGEITRPLASDAPSSRVCETPRRLSQGTRCRLS